MQKIAQLVLEQAARYPGMELEDAIKLLYQSEMGAGHFIEDVHAFEQLLEQELACADLTTVASLYPEPIGNGRCRVHLSGLGESIAPDTLACLCEYSARRYKGDAARLEETMRRLRHLVAQGELPWAPWQAEKIDTYLSEGMPPVRHSARFTALYHPHYQVLDVATAAYLPVFNAVDKALGSREHVLVGIDGMSHAGKSELAALLQNIYGGGIVHADHFFLQAAQREPARLAEVGGNIDYERLRPVARQAAEDRAFSYQEYDCVKGEPGRWHEVPPARVSQLEGGYALHPKVQAPCDVRVFLSVDAQVQRQRVQRRSPEREARFLQEWIPMENCYFSEFEIRQSCDVVVDTSELF